MAGGAAQRANRRGGGISAGRSRGTPLSRSDSAEPIAVPAARSRLCLFQLRDALHAEHFERTRGRGGRRADSRAGTAGGDSINATPPKKRSAARSHARPRAAGGGFTDRQKPRWTRFIFARAAVARGTCAFQGNPKRREREATCGLGSAYRNHPRGRQTLSILRKRQPVRQRPETAASS